MDRTIASVRAQTVTDLELILVDDGSTDNALDRALEIHDPRLSILRQSHQGAPTALNRGLAAARGEYIAFLDSDDLWRPKKLAFQADFMELHREIAVCQTEEIWIRNGVRVNPRAIHRKPAGDIFLSSLDLCLVSPSAVMMRRDLFMALGGFDEALPVCEDYDLWLRIAIDHQVALIAEPLVIKRGGHADQLSHSVWGMDRFRVIALQKLLRLDISRARREAAVDVLRRKVRILANGARKRGKEPEALACEAMLTEFDKESRNVGDSDSRARPSQRVSSANAGTLA